MYGADTCKPGYVWRGAFDGDTVFALATGRWNGQANVTVIGNNFVVANTNNAGPGSLRQAILEANVAIHEAKAFTANLEAGRV